MVGPAEGSGATARPFPLEVAVRAPLGKTRRARPSVKRSERVRNRTARLHLPPKGRALVLVVACCEGGGALLTLILVLKKVLNRRTDRADWVLEARAEGKAQMAASALACAAVTLGLRRGAIAIGVEDLPKVSHQIRKKEVHSLPYREGISGTKERTDLGSRSEDVKVGYKGK
ncbi:hypothetical protein V496_02457 [Pseudogymnoascus sp. VKM F-4515 (FW-2607)]|nr:hypothetical protein V496_02457 [Pseudogymnoascus sp. VKM F-4515 (FW-2607)]